MEYNYNNEQPPKTSLVTKLVILITFLFLVAAGVVWNFYTRYINDVRIEVNAPLTKEDIDAIIRKEPEIDPEKALSPNEIKRIIDAENKNASKYKPTLSNEEIDAILKAN